MRDDRLERLSLGAADHGWLQSDGTALSVWKIQGPQIQRDGDPGPGASAICAYPAFAPSGGRSLIFFPEERHLSPYSACRQ